MFGIGLPELFIILVIAIIVIGPDKLPDLARAVGKGIGEFRRATDELKSSFDADDDLREIKTQLTQAKDDMTSMVREHTKGMNVDNLAKSLEDGSLFADKAGKAPDAASEPPSETSDTAETDGANQTGATSTPDQKSDLPEDEHPPKSDV